MDTDCAALSTPESTRIAGPGRFAIEQQRTGLRQEAVLGILGVDAALDGMAALRERLLRPRQRLAGRDEQLRVHQIDAGDGFGDRMLDLEPRVHLEEIEPRVVAADPRAGTRSSRRCGSRRRARRATAASPIRVRSAGVSAGRRALLDDLLMAPLDRALALEQVDGVAVVVARRPGPRRGADVRSAARRRGCRRRTPRSPRAAPPALSVARRRRPTAPRACPCRRRRPRP